MSRTFRSLPVGAVFAFIGSNAGNEKVSDTEYRSFINNRVKQVDNGLRSVRFIR